MTDNKSAVELALLQLFDISAKIHQEAFDAGLAITNERNDYDFQTSRWVISELGKKLLALGGKPALHVAYNVPNSISTDESAMIKEEWEKLGLYVGDPDCWWNDFDAGVYHESAEAEQLAADKFAQYEESEEYKRREDLIRYRSDDEPAEQSAAE